MKVADAVRECAACPRCWALLAARCNTRTGRNHPERVRAAIMAALGITEADVTKRAPLPSSHDRPDPVKTPANKSRKR